MRTKFGNHRVDFDMIRIAGQQLTFADMFKASRHGRPAARTKSHPIGWPDRPVHHQQQILFDITPDLRHGRRVAPAPRDTTLAAALDDHITVVAERLKWKRRYTSDVRSAVRILLGLQHTPGAAITATEIEVLAQLRLPARTVREVLDEVGMLDDDRIPAIRTWFNRRTAGLPQPMRDELEVWFNVMHTGSTTAPRRRARSHTTIELYTTWALPTLTGWADGGHQSLREISRNDIIAALPASGVERSVTGRALRSIFEILKARRQVFVNPTARLRTWAPANQPPMPVDLDAVLAGLDSPDPARAAVIALVVFHGCNANQIRQLQLTDIRDRRLHIDRRTIPLAEAAGRRVAAYLDHRNQQWPDSINPHLFIHFRTAQRLEPVGYRWLKLTVDHPGGIDALRQDRILHEAIASGGDTRRLCDLFGLSISAATRYTNTLGHAALTDGR